MSSWMLGVTVTIALLAVPLAADTSDKFDFYFLVRQWLPSVCRSSHCKDLTNVFEGQFTIHGLWPNRDDGSWPSFCHPRDRFQETAVADIRSEMDHYWPSAYGSNTKFWTHEWGKHGTCAERQFHDEHDYFSSVLQLNHEYDPKVVMEKQGIVPSDTQAYKLSDVVDALSEGFGAAVEVHTSKGLVTEVWMCVSKALEVMDCPVDLQPSQQQHRKHSTSSMVKVPKHLPRRSRCFTAAAWAWLRRAVHRFAAKAVLLLILAAALCTMGAFAKRQLTDTEGMAVELKTELLRDCHRASAGRQRQEQEQEWAKAGVPQAQ